VDGKSKVAEILKQEGVEFVFCFPNNVLIDAMADAGIRPIISRVERTAINMADGYTRTTNGTKNGVCIFQAGPGIENAFSGVAQAYADSSPILILPGHQGNSRVGMTSDFNASANYQHVTKWSDFVNSSNRIPEMMRRAYTNLRIGRPQPVLLEMPNDVMNGSYNGADTDYEIVKPRKSSGDPKDIEAVAHLLVKADRPVIYAGQGVLYAQATDELITLSELLGAPVMTTTLGKSGFPENHPLSLGTGGNTCTKMVGTFLKDADVVFGIGTSFQKTLASAPIVPGKTIIQSTIDDKDINGEYAVDEVIIGDSKLVLQQLIECLRASQFQTDEEKKYQTIDTISRLKNEFYKEWEPRLTSNTKPISPYRVVWELENTLDKRSSIVTHDSGNPRDQIVPFYTATEPRGYLGWGNSTPLGAGFGLAMGAKLAEPNKTVVNLMGDTAVGMMGTDFETAVRESIGTITVIINNGAMGGYEKHMPIAIEKYNSKFTTGNYSDMAKSLGAHSERIEDPSEIGPAISRAVDISKDNQPVVLEFLTREEPILSNYY
tara:strand:- start:16862 stop:18502 length:1641 start_codon:yes stop_codon:yes gene_type:complete